MTSAGVKPIAAAAGTGKLTIDLADRHDRVRQWTEVVVRGGGGRASIVFPHRTELVGLVRR